MGKLCECGCGDPVNNLSARFIRGHHNRSQEIKEQKRKQIYKDGERNMLASLLRQKKRVDRHV